MSTVRTLLQRGVRLCPAPALSRSQARCLSTAGRTTFTSDESQSQQESSRTSPLSVGVVGLAASGLCVAWYLHSKENASYMPTITKLVPQFKASEPEGKGAKPPEKVSVRERRYKDFSSISFKGEPYMTPRDFLESVTLDKPRRKSVTCENVFFNFLLIQKLILSLSMTRICRIC